MKYVNSKFLSTFEGAVPESSSLSNKDVKSVNRLSTSIASRRNLHQSELFFKRSFQSDFWKNQSPSLT